MAIENDTRDPLRQLTELIETLRGPHGCPWDREQTVHDVRAYLLEEAHEVACAIDELDWRALRGELGDLLFQVAFVGYLAQEVGAFTLEEAAESARFKMIERHPHVFGDPDSGDEKLTDSGAVRKAWERRKHAAKGAPESHLAGVPATLPALLAAYRMTQKAAGLGFDWSSTGDVVAKLDEELAELRVALDSEGPDRVRDEIGDLIFTVANLARHLGVDPEAALAGTNLKFRRRFAHMEKALAARGDRMPDTPIDALEELWEQAKADD